MRIHLALLLAALLAGAGLSWSQAQKKKSTAGAAAKKTSTLKTAASSKKRASTKKRTTSARRRTPARGATWRSRQLAPEPERYREIQQALIDKGYLEGPATGKWDQASIDALRRFQQEQNLEPSGKINSLSLIALGLGPKYENHAPAAAVPQPSEAPAAQP